jgi:hypothetical protein
MLTDPKVVDFMKSVGIPSLILAALMAGIWQAASWTGQEVLKPLVSQQIEFMEHVADASKRNSDTLAKIGNAVEELKSTGNRQERILERITEDESK